MSKAKIGDASRNDALLARIARLVDEMHPGAAVAVAITDIEEGVCSTAFMRCKCGHMDKALAYGVDRLAEEAEAFGTGNAAPSEKMH